MGPEEAGEHGALVHSLLWGVGGGSPVAHPESGRGADRRVNRGRGRGGNTRPCSTRGGRWTPPRGVTRGRTHRRRRRGGRRRRDCSWVGGPLVPLRVRPRPALTSLLPARGRDWGPGGASRAAGMVRGHRHYGQRWSLVLPLSSKPFMPSLRMHIVETGHPGRQKGDGVPLPWTGPG